jgi:hypothetical protein
VIQMIVTFGTTRRNYRELDSRQMSGLTVRLLWDQRRDTVIVQVHDWGGADLVLYPPKSQARYAFQHPFAVAHRSPAGRRLPLPDRIRGLGALPAATLAR